MLSQREKISHSDASRLQGAGREEKMRPAVECSGLGMIAGDDVPSDVRAETTNDVHGSGEFARNFFGPKVCCIPMGTITHHEHHSSF
jgi:hypothetical protein